MANKLLYTWDKVKSVDATILSTHSESLIFDGNKRTLWHKGRQFGNAYYMSDDVVGGETFNDFRTNTAIGTYSHAEGSANIANASYSHAEGYAVQASAISSHAEGYYTATHGLAAHAEGVNTVAYYKGAHSEGISTYAFQEGTHAEGAYSSAYGIASHTEGTYSVTYGEAGHAEGYNTVAKYKAAHAEGGFTFAEQEYSHAEGLRTASYGIGGHAEGVFTYVAAGKTGAHVEGGYNIADGVYSHVEGSHNSTYNMAAHTEGLQNKSFGVASHAEGMYTRVGGTNTQPVGGHAEGYGTKAGVNHVSHIAANGMHAEGLFTVAMNTASHSEGCFTYAIGDGAHSEGAYTYACGAYSHAGGLLTYAFAPASTTLGIGTVANEPGSLSIGSYNLAYDVQGPNIGSTLFAIGDGASYTARHNLLGIHNGAYLGDGRYGNYRMIFNGDVDSYSVCASSYITAYNTITAGNDVVINNVVTLTTKQPVEYVDLGLPSGTLWATQNAGGDTTRYFQWADTNGHVTADIPKRTNFSWGDYKYCKGTNQTLTKYCNVPSYGYNNFIDSLTALEATDDATTKSCIDGVAATVDRANELLSNTDVYLIKGDATEIHGTLYNNVVKWDSTPDATELLSGVEFRSKADASVKVFVPASGSIYESDTATIGHAGGFWLSNLGEIPYSGKALYFDNKACKCTDLIRAYGYPFRAVKSNDSKGVYASLPLSGGVLATESSVDSLRSDITISTISSTAGNYDEWNNIISG